VVGSGYQVEELVRFMSENPWSGTQIVGQFDDDINKEVPGWKGRRKIESGGGRKV